MVGVRRGEDVETPVAWPPHAVSSIPTITMPLDTISRYEVLAANMGFSQTLQDVCQ